MDDRAADIIMAAEAFAVAVYASRARRQVAVPKHYTRHYALHSDPTVTLCRRVATGEVRQPISEQPPQGTIRECRRCLVAVERRAARGEG